MERKHPLKPTELFSLLWVRAILPLTDYPLPSESVVYVRPIGNNESGPKWGVVSVTEHETDRRLFRSVELLRDGSRIAVNNMQVEENPVTSDTLGALGKLIEALEPPLSTLSTMNR